MILSAPLSFLHNSAAGSLINRFSQDLRHVDIILPMAFSIFLFGKISLYIMANVN
jgi:ATP-binding cassette, subfamily C (CFTR/MRP), member 1